MYFFPLGIVVPADSYFSEGLKPPTIIIVSSIMIMYVQELILAEARRRWELKRNIMGIEWDRSSDSSGINHKGEDVK